MEVILLERVAKLGQMGEVVRVKDGFARNFLLPQGKALRATEANKSKFETMKVNLPAKNLATKAEADKIGSKLDGKSFAVVRQASETGQLYGSVSPRDLAVLLTENGFEVERNQVWLNAPIKTIGQHKVPVQLHPEARGDDHGQRRAQRRRGRSGSPAARTSPSAAKAAPRRTRRRPRRLRHKPCSSRARRAEGESEAEAPAAEAPAEAKPKARKAKAEPKAE